ncbi:hypothetical protein, partial [Candidatus Oleimmundimicrobium sp.]|uniref:hypothetical protein n=1 Tax=Candidatus Oleimmundimicrobium sp. TaxID=3060597 RepID=UPI002719D361
DPDAFRAEAEAIMATMRLRPSPYFETPDTEAQIMGGLFELHLPRGWRVFMRRGDQVLILTPSGFVALTTGDPARFALGLGNHEGSPPITEGSFLGRSARIAEGRAAPQALAGGGVITTIALDTCLANGDPIAIAIASSRAWQGAEDYTAFIDGLRLNLPHDAIPCRPALGEAATATDQATAPPPASHAAPAM